MLGAGQVLLALTRPSPRMISDIKDSATRYLHFGPLRAPVRFEGCEDLIAAMRSLFLGWDISVNGMRGDHTPVIRYRWKNDRFIWHSKHYPSPENWEKRRRYLVVKDTAADFHPAPGPAAAAIFYIGAFLSASPAHNVFLIFRK